MNVHITSYAEDVYILNSIHNHYSVRYGHFNSFVEKTYSNYLKGTRFNPRFIHKATLSDYLDVLYRDGEYIFWIGHGGSRFVDSVDEGIITDYNGKNLSAVFRDLNHNLKHLSIVTCESQEILSRDDIDTFAGKIDPLVGIKQSLVKFHQKFNINRSCQTTIRRKFKDTKREEICHNQEGPVIDIIQSKNSREKVQEIEEIQMQLRQQNNLPEILYIYLNGELIDLVQKSQVPGHTLKVNKNKLKKVGTNELILSSGESGKKTVHYNFDNVELISEQLELKRFGISGITTLGGKTLFEF